MYMLGLLFVTKTMYWFGQCLFTACWVLFMCVGSGMAFMVFDVSIQELNEMVDILQMTFSNAFLWKKTLLLGSNKQWFSFGSSDGLVLNKWQVII